MAESDAVHFFENKVKGKADVIFDFLPFFSETGDLTRIEGIDTAIHAIRTLLMTPLGHYPFDPEYGSLLYKKLFEPADQITRDEILFEVKDRVAQFEDRVKVENVDVTVFDEGKGVQVDVHINRDGVKGKVSIFTSQQNRMFGLEDEITAGLD